MKELFKVKENLLYELEMLADVTFTISHVSVF